MGIRTETREIAGMNVTTTQLDVFRATEMVVRLGKLIAPAAGKLSGVDMSSDISALAPALATLMMGLAPGDASALVRDLLVSTTCVHEGKQIPLGSDEMIRTVYNGRLQALLQTLAFVIEVNFADFFGGALTGSADQVPVRASR